MKNSLKNKKILISAGASGIGWATAKVCLLKGATVFLCDVEQKYLNRIKKHKQINKNYLLITVMLLVKMMYYNYLEKFQKKQKN